MAGLPAAVFTASVFTASVSDLPQEFQDHLPLFYIQDHYETVLSLLKEDNGVALWFFFKDTNHYVEVGLFSDGLYMYNKKLNTVSKILKSVNNFPADMRAALDELKSTSKELILVMDMQVHNRESDWEAEKLHFDVQSNGTLNLTQHYFVNERGMLMLHESRCITYPPPKITRDDLKNNLIKHVYKSFPSIDRSFFDYGVIEVIVGDQVIKSKPTDPIYLSLKMHKKIQEKHPKDVSNVVKAFYNAITITRKMYYSQSGSSHLVKTGRTFLKKHIYVNNKKNEYVKSHGMWITAKFFKVFHKFIKPEKVVKLA